MIYRVINKATGLWKPFKNMSAAEKNELLEIICKMLGIIEQ